MWVGGGWLKRVLSRGGGGGVGVCASEGGIRGFEGVRMGRGD